MNIDACFLGFVWQIGFFFLSGVSQLFLFNKCATMCYSSTVFSLIYLHIYRQLISYIFCFTVSSNMSFVPSVDRTTTSGITGWPCPLRLFWFHQFQLQDPPERRTDVHHGGATNSGPFSAGPGEPPPDSNITYFKSYASFLDQPWFDTFLLYIFVGYQ